jgi:hypothetical protein
VPPKSNSCPKCKQSLVLSAGRLTHFNCTSCHRAPEELDDWAVNHHVPFLFQTRRGVKAQWLPGGVEAAARVYMKYFDIEGKGFAAALHEIGEDDRKSWRFISREEAVAFAHQFACVCGERSWELSAMRSADVAARKAVRAATPHVWKGIVWGVTKLVGVITGARKESQGFFKGRGK